MSTQPQRINPQELREDISQLAPQIGGSIADEAQFVNDKFKREIQLEYIKSLREHNRTLEQNNAQRKIYAGHYF